MVSKKKSLEGSTVYYCFSFFIVLFLASIIIIVISITGKCIYILINKTPSSIIRWSCIVRPFKW